MIRLLSVSSTLNFPWGSPRTKFGLGIVFSQIFHCISAQNQHALALDSSTFTAWHPHNLHWQKFVFYLHWGHQVWQKSSKGKFPWQIKCQSSWHGNTFGVQTTWIAQLEAWQDNITKLALDVVSHTSVMAYLVIRPWGISGKHS
jgi:hypothetical protein